MFDCNGVHVQADLFKKAIMLYTLSIHYSGASQAHNCIYIFWCNNHTDDRCSFRLIYLMYQQVLAQFNTSILSPAKVVLPQMSAKSLSTGTLLCLRISQERMLKQLPVDCTTRQTKIGSGEARVFLQLHCTIDTAIESTIASPRFTTRKTVYIF